MYVHRSTFDHTPLKYYTCPLTISNQIGRVYQICSSLSYQAWNCWTAHTCLPFHIRRLAPILISVEIVAAIRQELWTRMAMHSWHKLRLLHNSFLGFLHPLLLRQTGRDALQRSLLASNLETHLDTDYAFSKYLTAITREVLRNMALTSFIGVH